MKRGSPVDIERQDSPVINNSETYPLSTHPMKRPFTEKELRLSGLSNEEKKLCPSYDKLSVFSKVFYGCLYPFHSIVFIAQHLICGFMICDLIVFVLYIIFVIVVGFGVSFLISWLVILDQGVGVVNFAPYQLFILFGCVGGVILSVLLFALSGCCIQLYFSVCFRRLSNIVEQIMKGSKNNLPVYYCPRGGGDFSYCRCGRRIFMFATCYLFKYVIHKLFFFILSGVLTPIPVIGQILVTFLFVAELGYSCFTAVFSRKNMNYLETLVWTFRHLDIVFGMGLGSFLVYTIFPLNLFYFFFADVAGTRCFVHVDYRERINELELDLNQDGGLLIDGKKSRKGDGVNIRTERTPLLKQTNENNDDLTPKNMDSSSDGEEKEVKPMEIEDDSTSDDVVEEGADDESEEPKSDDEESIGSSSSGGGGMVDTNTLVGMGKKKEGMGKGMKSREGRHVSDSSEDEIVDDDNNNNNEDEEKEEQPETGDPFADLSDHSVSTSSSSSADEIGMGKSRRRNPFDSLTLSEGRKNDFFSEDVKTDDEGDDESFEDYTFDEVKDLEKLKEIEEEEKAKMEESTKKEDVEEVKTLADPFKFSEEDMGILNELKLEDEIKEEKEEQDNNPAKSSDFPAKKRGMSEDDIALLDYLEKEGNVESDPTAISIEKMNLSQEDMDIMKELDSGDIDIDNDDSTIEKEEKPEEKEEIKPKRKKPHHAPQQSVMELMQFVDSLDSLDFDELRDEKKEEKVEEKKEENKKIDFGQISDATIDFNDLKSLLENDAMNKGSDSGDESESDDGF